MGLGTGSRWGLGLKSRALSSEPRICSEWAKGWTAPCGT